MSGDREAKVRRYRLGEPRRAGLFGTLAWTMLVPLIAALGAAWLAVAGFVPPPVAVPVVAAGLWLALGRVRGRPAHAVLPAMAAFGWRRLRHRHRWCRPVPLLTDGEVPVALPPPLAGLALFEADVTWLVPGRSVPVGVVHDRGGAHGDGGDAGARRRPVLVARRRGPGCAPRRVGGGVGRVRPRAVPTWCGWRGTTGRRRCRSPTRSASCRPRWADEPVSPARASYLALMDVVAPKVTDHDMLSRSPWRCPRRRAGGPPDRAGGGVDDAVGRAGACSAPVSTPPGCRSPGCCRRPTSSCATRGRSDPAGMEQLATYRQSLAAAAGAAAPTFGPFHVCEELTAVRVDRSVHRTWWFARWPRREVAAPAGWTS